MSTLSLLYREACLGETEAKVRKQALAPPRSISASIPACKLTLEFPLHRNNLDCITASSVSYKCHLTTDVTCLFSRVTSWHV